MQLERRERRGGLVGDAVQDLGVALVQLALARPRSHAQPAHDLAAVAEVEGGRVLGHGRPGTRDGPALVLDVQLDLGAPEPEDETTRWQTTSGTARHVRAGAAARSLPSRVSTAIRVRAVPVVEPVDPGGQPPGQRLEARPGGAGGERGARCGVSSPGMPRSTATTLT